MNKLKLISSIMAGAMLVSSAGCGSKERTAEEKAAAARAYQADQKRQTEEQIAAFPAAAPKLIADLRAITARDVSDMDVAVVAVRQFDRAAMDIRIIEDAVSEGREVSPEAIEAKDELKRVLIQTQRALFPVMRRTYAAYMSDAVSGAQANFRAVGRGGKTLRAASPSFTSREVVMDAHYTLAGQATRFRFTKAEYVYSLTGASDVITLHGDDDGDID